MENASSRPLDANGFVNRRSRVQSAPPAQESATKDESRATTTRLARDVGARGTPGLSRRSIRAIARRVLSGALTEGQALGLLVVS